MTYQDTRWVGGYPYAEMQSVYSAAHANWARLIKVRVDLGVMAMMTGSTLIGSLELEPRYQIQF